jgi:hypothetical protein
MELGKYKLAMRPKKYLTREFVVYKAAPEAMDDVITEEQNIIDTMPSQAPAMDNYMPEIPGMEDPSLRQVELADGGVVQREGFAEGTKIQKEFLFDFIKENKGISSRAKASKLNELGYINSRGGPITDSMIEAFITNNPELKGQGKSVVSSLEDLKKEASPKQLSDFESGLIDEQTFRNRVVVGRGDKKRTPEYRQAASKRKYERVIADPERKARLKETQARFTEKKYLEKGMFPSAKKPKDAFWRDLLRSADKNERVGWVSERPNKFPRNVFEGLELMDNKTGKKITYNNLSNHPEYSKAIKAYEKKFLINQLDIPYNIKEKITYQRKPGGTTNNIVIQHPEGIGKNPFNTSIATQFENLREDKIKNKFNKNFNKAKTLTEKKQIVKNFVTELAEKTPNILSQPGKKLYGSEKTLSELVSKGLDKNELKIFNTALKNLSSTEKKVFSNFGNKVSMGFDPTDVLKMLPEKEYQIMKGAMSKVGNLTTMGVRGAQELLVGTGPVGLGITAALTVPFMVADLAEGKRFSEALQNQASALTFGFIPEADKRIIEEIGGSEAGVGFEIQQNIDKLKILQNDLREAEKRTSDDIMDPEAELAQSNFVENTRKSINKTFQDLLPYLNEQGQIIAPEYNAYLQASNKAEQERAYRKGIGDLQAYNVGFDDISISEEGPFQQDIDKLLKGKEQLEKSYSKILSADDLINEYAYGGRVGLAAGTIPRAVNWVAKRIQDINKLIKTKRAKAEDFLDEIEILNKAEELNLTKEQVGQILRQQKQAATEKYLKRPIEGDPDLESRLPYDPNATPRNIKRGNVEKGGDPKDKPILPINPMIGGEDPRGSLQDPGRRDVLKGMGLLGAGVAAGKLGLLKLGKVIKKAPLTNIVKPMGKTMTQFPKWFPTLINRIRKEGKQIPIYKEVEVTLTKPEYDKLSKEGVTVYDRHLGRTDWYKEELIKEGVPRYYTDKKTDEIIGYKYEVKDLPGTIVKEMNGEEIRVYFPNAYGRNVEMTYKAPKVSVDMKGKKVKYDAEFEVNDAVPEMAGPEDVPDFFPGTVDNLDDVYGGASKIEQYALKLKKPRTTQGDEVVNAWDAGQPHMSLKELKKQKKQRRRDYAKQQVDEKPATFEDREFLKNFLDAGDDID